MEEHIAILMSDLSGYTALTEIHGATSAADLIDRYITIVESCLVGDCHLQERTGDEVMVVSSSPHNLLLTAFEIIHHTSNEPYFLQIHGGLHYGNILRRNNRFFGSTINLVSRIAAKAAPGTFWCSREFLQEIPEHKSSWVSVGNHTFKNINKGMELFELGNVNLDPPYIDSVCRMVLLELDHAVKHPEKEGVFFCSHTCLKVYMEQQLAGHED